MKKVQKGFTLIEILVVIGMIALLAAIVIVAINPARQFAQGRNTQRNSNVNTILNGIGQFTADNKGVLPSGITTSKLYIEKTGGADLCSDLMPTYIASLPVDPSATSTAAVVDCSTSYDTGYTVQKDVQNRITVCAPKSTAETALGTSPAEICVTR